MHPDHWRRIQALYDAAVAQPPTRRNAFLSAACAGDETLRQEVEALLVERQSDGEVMAPPALVASPAQRRPSFVPGAHIGTYELGGVLGVGGMGEVYRARDTRLGRDVAIKLLPREFSTDQDRLARFEREARILAALSHPNVGTIYGIEDHLNASETPVRALILELVEGETLAERIDRGALTLAEATAIGRQIAEALDAAHEQGIVHRDLKPANIKVTPNRVVKVLDFGLAKLSEAVVYGSSSDPARAIANTQAGATMGTLAYMSPEQATGETIDHRTDIWSLGVVLYELVTKQKPFRGANRQSTVNAILSSEPNSAVNSDSTIPSELDLVLEKALEKDRELRYQTASDFRADLRRLLRTMDSAPSNSRHRAIAELRRKSVSRRWIWPVVGVIGILLAISAWFLFKPGPHAPDWSRATHVQLTDHPGTEFFPSLAPDGRSFVFASKANGNFDLFLQRVGGKNPTLLTKDSTADDTQPAFSPDGEHIAFRSDREPAGIYVMEATGENLRPVTPGGFHPSWSPDSKQIVISEAGRDAPDVRNTIPSKLWIVNVETGARHLLTESDAMQPAWSPHGARIAFWFMPPSVGRSDIATVPSGGGEPLVITKDASTNWNPVWSPDGKYLYFASDRSGNMNFWRVAIDEETGRVLSEPEAVVTPSTFSGHLNFSRDGRRMIYVQTNRQSNIQAVEFDVNRERKIGEPFWITRGDRQIVRPELSPDGKQFVMRVPRRTQDDLAVLSRDGSSWHDLTNDKFFDRYPRWSADGKKIAFVSDRSGSYEIWTIDADGTNLRQVTFTGIPGTSFPLWSPDGKQLLFRTNRVSYLLDLSRDWQQQTPQSLPTPANPEDFFVAWDWSPDGKKLGGTFSGSSGNGIGYYSFDTGRYEKLAEYYDLPMWLPDSRRFVFSHEGKALIADIETKKVRELYSHQPEEIRSIAVSRDGRLLYYTLVSSESDIWLLELE